MNGVCGDHHEIVVQLEAYGESVVAKQRIGPGPSYWEFWAAFDGKSFSVVIVGRGTKGKDEIACLYAYGGQAEKRPRS